MRNLLSTSPSWASQTFCWPVFSILKALRSESVSSGVSNTHSEKFPEGAFCLIILEKILNCTVTAFKPCLFHYQPLDLKPLSTALEPSGAASFHLVNSLFIPPHFLSLQTRIQWKALPNALEKWKLEQLLPLIFPDILSQGQSGWSGVICLCRFVLTVLDCLLVLCMLVNGC